MAHVKSSKSQEFDTLVIGGGLGGLLIAHQLEGTGRRVALVEALDALGGTNRPHQSPIGEIDHGLKFFPATPAAHESLEWLESVLGHGLNIEELDAAPVTYDNGRFQPFIGFGNTNPEAVSELDYFASPKRLLTSSTPKDWVKELSSSFAGSVFLNSHVTQFQYDDGFLIEVTLNGTKKLSAREYIYTAPPQLLSRLLPDATASGRQRQKLAKGEFFTAIYLDLMHAEPVTESRSLHVLKGANEEPLVGAFQPPVTDTNGSTVQHSQWMTFIPADLTEDNEIAATALKKIKRQVRRAYENALNGLIFERILVTPGSHGEISGLLTDDQRWPKISNLWIASNFFNPNRNLLGTLDQARQVLNSFADEPMVTDIDEADTSPSSPTL